MTVSAARFTGPYGPQLYDLEVRVPEHSDPSEWLVVLDQMDANSVSVIQNAPIVAVEEEPAP